MRKVDILVLGAGIVGSATAFNLLKKGKSVAIVDRREPGHETSYGNAGIVETDGLEPIIFPRDPAALIRYAGNRAPESHYHPSHLPKLTPWMLALHRASDDEHQEHFFQAIAPLMQRALAAHHKLAIETGSLPLYRDTGWLRMYRSEKGYQGAVPVLARADRIEMPYEVLEGSAVLDLEPALADVAYRTVFWPNTQTVANPGVVSESITEHFAAKGGTFSLGEAETLKQVDGKWQIDTARGPLEAAQVVVCLGPWSQPLLRKFGYDYPMQVVRGYHTHLQPLLDAKLSRPVVDVENGYVLSPMSKGVRLTTAFEFAARDADATPVQVERVLPHARQLFPLGEEITERWLGCRPCFPDTLPLIDQGARHPGLWFHYGHAYLGFTLGPILGQLLAEQIVGGEPEVDLAPYSATRFG